jgi:hypothetical protein
MSNTKFSLTLMALVAMSFFRASDSIAQTRVFTPKIKTPETSKEVIKDTSKPVPEEKSPSVEEPEPERPAVESRGTSDSTTPRRLQQHGLGIGIGETFLLGNYSKHGDDKITMDVLYSYAASYSFDLLVNAHYSNHKSDNENMKIMGLTSSIKGRLVEFDNLSPYILGGLGFYAPTAKREQGSSTEWTTRKVTFGLNFGGGLDLRLNENYVIGVLGQMHLPFKVELEDEADLRGYYFKLLITGMYLF